MIRLLKKIFYSSLILLIGFVCLISFLATTTPGLYTVIKLSRLYLPGTIQIHQLKGRLLDEFYIGELDYYYNSTHIKISQLNVQWSLNTLLKKRVQIKEAHAKTVEFNEHKVLHNLKLSGLIDSQVLKIDALKFNYLNDTVYAQMQIDPRLPHALTGAIKLNPDSSDQSLLKGKLSIGGDINQLQWTGDVRGPVQLSLNGTLKHLSELKQIIKWRNVNVPISSENSFNSPEGRVKVSGTLPKVSIEMTSKINKDHQSNWQVNANFQGTLPKKWNFNATVSQTQDPKSKIEGLYSTIAIQGEIQDTNKGALTLTLAPGHYQMAEDSTLPSLQFLGGTVKASLSTRALSGTGSLKIDSNTKMNLVFNLPDFNLNQGLSNKQPISAELTLLLDSFDFLKSFSSEINNPQGHLIASLKAKGTRDKMQFESKLNLNKASVSLPSLGLNLNAIDVTVLAKKKKWEVNGTIDSAHKKLFLKGQGILSTNPEGELSLQGSDFPIINTSEYQLNITPQLKLNFSPTDLNISGTVVVPFAQIKPQSLSNSLTVSDDVVYKTKQTETPPTSYNTNVDVRVEMGKAVELTFKGLHATLGGTVNLKQLPHGPLTANGELNVIKGEYKAYGQDLAIEQGELIFTGGRIDNPGINLRAAKKIDTTSTSLTSSNQLFDFNNNNLQNANVRGNISVGVEVTGRLSAPKIQLFSNPSILSQADILSMLVLGRPASQANKAGAQLLLAAISSMNLGTGTNGAQLLEQLKQNLGFDLNVQTNSNYNLVTNQVSDSTALVVGKSLSKRIYLSYNVGLSQADPNVLTLKYLLNKFLSIQISSSDTGNGIDILYTTNK